MDKGDERKRRAKMGRGGSQNDRSGMGDYFLFFCASSVCSTRRVGSIGKDWQGNITYRVLGRGGPHLSDLLKVLLRASALFMTESIDRGRPRNGEKLAGRRYRRVPCARPFRQSLPAQP